MTVVTLPDSKLAAAVEADEQKRLTAARDQMSAEDVEKVVAETKARSCDLT